MFLLLSVWFALFFVFESTYENHDVFGIETTYHKVC